MLLQQHKVNILFRQVKQFMKREMCLLVYGRFQSRAFHEEKGTVCLYYLVRHPACFRGKGDHRRASPEDI